MTSGASIHHSPTRTRSLLAAAFAGFAFSITATAQTPLYQWDFDNGSGANTGTGSGGTLTTNGTASFLSAGVSGQVGDNALSVSNSYTGGIGSGNSASTSAANLLTSSGPLNTFTLTLWVNLTAGDFSNFGRIFLLAPSASLDSGSNPGIALLMNAGNLEYRVNGNTGGVTPVTGLNTSVAGQWVFLAFSYDGLATNPAFSATNQALYGNPNNAVVLIGNSTTGVTVGGSDDLYVGATPAVSPGPALNSADDYAFFGNRSGGDRGLTGLIDDVRLYSGELTVEQLNAVRIEAVPEPTISSLLLLGALGAASLRRRRQTAVAV